MKKRKVEINKFRLLLIGVYTCFLFLLAFSIGIMPMGNTPEGEITATLYVSATGFWLGLLGTIAMAVLINHFRKKSKFQIEHSKKKQFGLICFFQNKEAMIADILMFASILGFIITRMWIHSLQVSFLLLALFVFSFGMHCMLNGINYRYIKH